jgi:hypothetical protein
MFLQGVDTLEEAFLRPRHPLQRLSSWILQVEGAEGLQIFVGD